MIAEWKSNNGNVSIQNMPTYCDLIPGFRDELIQDIHSLMGLGKGSEVVERQGGGSFIYGNQEV